MSIKYLCPRCSKLLNMAGSDAINEVSRKNCEGCGDNEDNLVVVDASECDIAIEIWNKNH